MLTKIKSMREEGFTLVELLVVIVILVALAAIAIPVFLNQRAAAEEAASRSTVASIASFVNSGIANGTLDDEASPVAGPGSVASPENGSIAVPEGFNVTWDSTAGTFCVDNADVDDATVYHYDETTGAVADGACP